MAQLKHRINSLYITAIIMGIVQFCLLIVTLVLIGIVLIHGGYVNMNKASIMSIKLLLFVGAIGLASMTTTIIYMAKAKDGNNMLINSQKALYMSIVTLVFNINIIPLTIMILNVVARQNVKRLNQLSTDKPD